MVHSAACSSQMQKIITGSSAGIMEFNKLKTNRLGTVLYLGYLAFEFPQNFCLQRFPVGKQLSFNIFIWGIALCCRAVCKDFYGLLIIRLLPGACEDCITVGFLITSSMFNTRAEQIERVGYWYASSGFSGILSSFIIYDIGAALG
ncbi:hypothetical protein BDZ89DRAFT_1133085 [Hymenopellis radicata]|nr:hypothetical protein BDZ89DRAFT_1133085 [Hymenopellis radicata]